MKRALAVVLFLGCGGGPKPAPVVARTAPPAPPPAAKVVVADCAGAARALITEKGVAKIAKEKRDGARAAAEAEAIAACLDDQWATATISCTVARAAPSTCLDTLNAYQAQSYRAHLADWQQNWTTGIERHAGAGDADGVEGGEEGGVVGGVISPENDPTPGDLPRPKPPAREEWISCSENLGDIAAYEPKIKPDAVDRDFVISTRSDALLRSCEYHWPNPTKKCFGATHDAAGIAACRASLDAPGKNAITNAITDADGKVAQVEGLKKNPRAIDCKAVAAAHYTDEALRTKLTSIDPVERKRAFADSRVAMADACTKEKWSPISRACVAAAKPTEFGGLDGCFGKDGFRAAYRFGVPAQGVFFKTGIAECDTLADTVKKLSTCDKFDERQRRMLIESFAMRIGMWIDSAGGGRFDAAGECKETRTYYEREGRERGCAL